MALNDIDKLPDDITASETGHIEDHEHIAAGLKSIKEILESGQAEPISLGSTYEPVTDVFPASDLISDICTAEVPTGWSGLTGTLWNSPKLNTQAMKLVEVVPGNPNAGCLNKPSSRDVGATFEFEFDMTSDRLAPMFQGFGPTDTQVYIQQDDVWYRLKDKPMSYSTAGQFFRDIKFASYRTRRIRIVAPYIYFYQILHEGNAVIKRSPDRLLVGTTGDSYFDGGHNASAGGVSSAESYYSYGIITALMEKTGWALARLAQGGTGLFNNGSGTKSGLTDIGPVNSTVFGSDLRMDAYRAYNKKFDLWISNGTINDGDLGTEAEYRERFKLYLDTLSNYDPDMPIIIIGPEPVNDPQPGNVHDVNRLIQIDVAKNHAQVIGYVDPFDPGNSWWSGTGTEANPNPYDQQSKIVGMDGIHTNYAGNKLYAFNIAEAIKQFKIRRKVQA